MSLFLPQKPFIWSMYCHVSLTNKLHQTRLPNVFSNFSQRDYFIVDGSVKNPKLCNLLIKTFTSARSTLLGEWPKTESLLFNIHIAFNMRILLFRKYKCYDLLFGEIFFRNNLFVVVISPNIVVMRRSIDRVLWCSTVRSISSPFSNGVIILSILKLSHTIFNKII